MGLARRTARRSLLAAGLVAGAASAKPPSTPVAPERPPVSLKVALAETGPDHEWDLTLENTSGMPLRVVDDPRLLWLEVSRPGDAKAKTCKLPDDVFPKTAGERTTRELKAGESITHHLDPRFYCFSPVKEETLVPSAQVTPHYGWPSKTQPAYERGRRVERKLPDLAPFVAEPVDSDTFGPLKNTTGDLVILDGRYAAWAGSPAPEETDAKDDEGEQPEIAMVRGSDAQSEPSVLATVRVKNPGKSKVAVFVRRELVTFEVLTPSGTVTCDAEPDARTPDRRAFTTLAPRASMTLASRLVELCPRGTFGAQGLYLVHARLDASVPGDDVGLDAFTGTLHTERPALVRVRHELRLVPNHGARSPGGQVPPAQPGAPDPNAIQLPPTPPPPPVPPPPPPPPPPTP